jgi:hypothetical protein
MIGENKPSDTNRPQEMKNIQIHDAEWCLLLKLQNLQATETYMT